MQIALDVNILYPMKRPIGHLLRNLSGPVLITGHTGFKGTWLSLLLEKLNVPTIGFSLYPENESLFVRTKREGKIPEKFADINDYSEIHDFISKEKPGAIVHLAAQSLVIDAYINPKKTFETNVLGTVNLLSAATSQPSVKAVEVITTDKVYFNDNSGKKFIETDKLGGTDPYSASKVATESAVDAWAKISEINSGPLIFSCRAGNIIGGGDLSPNRLLSDLVKNKYFSIPSEIRNPKSTRPWQYVLDPLYGYVLALENSMATNKATSFNFGPEGRSLSVSEVIQIFELKTGNEMPLVYRNDGVFYESEFLELNSTKALRELGWSAKISQKKAVELTVSWWEKVFNNLDSAESECFREIEIYLSLNDES